MVLCHKDDIAAPHRILNLIKKYKITCIDFVPGMLNAFLSALAEYNGLAKELSSLRFVITGGEALPPETVKKWYGRVDIPLNNFYGPTEATVDATYFPILKQDSRVLIGTPIANTRIYIVNKRQQPVPVDVMGEICIAGDGLARGYLHKPELTAEKFVNNPFGESAKMYKTGDYGRWRSDGNIEYLGRKDDQVKIRGYRIELGEIENALNQCQEISEAVVLVKGENDGNKNLVAYVVAKTPINQNSIKAYLKTVLPEYMVPSLFVEMKALPVNSNGKIDRRLLLQKEVKRKTSSVNFKAPETETEKMMASIWKDILKVNKIGVHDNFFDMGGHSLIAIKLMTRLENETGIRLPLAILFECPTIRQLSHRIDNDQLDVWECLVPVKTTGNKPPVYIVHGVGGHVLLLNLLVKYIDPQQPVYGFQPRGIGGKAKPQETVEEMAALYIHEMLQQNPDGPFALAGFSFGGLVAFEMAQQLKAMGKEVRMVALFDTYLSEKHKNAPLLATAYHAVSSGIKKVVDAAAVLSSKHAPYKLAFEKKKAKEKLVEIYQKTLWLKKKKHEKKSHMYYIYKIKAKLHQASEKYMPEKYDGDVILFRAKLKTYYCHDYTYLGWKPFINGKIDIKDMEGEHESMFHPPNNKRFSEVLQQCLNEAFAPAAQQSS